MPPITRNQTSPTYVAKCIQLGPKDFWYNFFKNVVVSMELPFGFFVINRIFLKIQLDYNFFFNEKSLASFQVFFSIFLILKKEGLGFVRTPRLRVRMLCSGAANLPFPRCSLVVTPSVCLSSSPLLLLRCCAAPHSMFLFSSFSQR